MNPDMLNIDIIFSYDSKRLKRLSDCNKFWHALTNGTKDIWEQEKLLFPSSYGFHINSLHFINYVLTRPEHIPQ